MKSLSRHPFNRLRGRQKSAQADRFPDAARTASETAEIYHSRREISRLSIEIAEDQHRANQNRCLHSAFIQFERSIDAQVVSQSVVHPSPFQLSPQYVGDSISAVVWDHVGLKWWECYIRNALAIGSMAAIIIGWAVPVAFTGFLSQLGIFTDWFQSLVHYTPWLLGFLQGILPQAMLVILTILLPSIIRLLVEQQGFALRTAPGLPNGSSIIQRCHNSRPDLPQL